MVNVIKVNDMTEETRVEREMVLIRVEANKETRAEIFRIVDIFRAKVVDVGQKNYMLELTGDQEKITAFIDLIRPNGIKEIARTGTVALTREIHKKVEGEINK